MSKTPRRYVTQTQLQKIGACKVSRRFFAKVFPDTDRVLIHKDNVQYFIDCAVKRYRGNAARWLCTYVRRTRGLEAARTLRKHILDLEEVTFDLMVNEALLLETEKVRRRERMVKLRATIVRLFVKLCQKPPRPTPYEDGRL